MTVRQATRAALGLLTRRDRRLYSISVVMQMATSVLDLAGVLLLGLVGALAVTTVQSQPPPAIVAALADTLGLGDWSPQALVALFASVAAVFLLAKSVVSSLLTRRIFTFLANRQALVSARLTKELLSRPMTFVQKRSSQETAYALIQGSGAATLMILGQLSILLSEVSLLLLLGVALLIIDPAVTLGAILFFGAFGFILQKVMGSWASRIGTRGATADIDSLNTLQEALSTYRELSVLHRRDLYVDRVRALRWKAATVSADRQFLMQFPKYVFEVALVIGGFALAGFLFMTESSVAAMGTLALFLAAGTRIMPSMLRLQGAAITMRDAAGMAGPLLALAADLGHPMADPSEQPSPAEWARAIEDPRVGLFGDMRVEHVTLTYPGADSPALSDVSLDVTAGSVVALVGRSGAGKSTVADLLLGILHPDQGTVTIDGEPPIRAIEQWPGGLAYVPQDVSLANGTVRDNVALGLPADAVNDDRVWRALALSGLDETVRFLPEQLATPVGERGFKLSGGQRQRLGIARALYSGPKILVLDEATSALDAETENSVASMIRGLHGEVTLVIIAHRLSTVRHADQVVYLDNGRVVGSGTFVEVRAQVPDFDRQAELMGLQ